MLLTLANQTVFGEIFWRSWVDHPARCDDELAGEQQQHLPRRIQPRPMNGMKMATTNTLSAIGSIRRPSPSSH